MGKRDYPRFTTDEVVEMIARMIDDGDLRMVVIAIMIPESLEESRDRLVRSIGEL